MKGKIITLISAVLHTTLAHCHKYTHELSWLHRPAYY